MERHFRLPVTHTFATRAHWKSEDNRFARQKNDRTHESTRKSGENQKKNCFMYILHILFGWKWKSSAVDGIAPAAIGRLVIHITVVTVVVTVVFVVAPAVVYGPFGSSSAFLFLSSFSFLLNLARRWKVKWKLCACATDGYRLSIHPSNRTGHYKLTNTQYRYKIVLAIICVCAKHIHDSFRSYYVRLMNLQTHWWRWWN